MYKPFSLIIAFIVVFGSSSLHAQNETLSPVKVDVEPLLDGDLNDPVWMNSRVAKGFTSYWPIFGKPYPFDTEVYMVSLFWFF